MHIRPWEIDLLTYEQFELACAAIDEYDKANRQETTDPGGDE
jgi:hypothetical protein